LDKRVRQIRKDVAIFETDQNGQQAAKKLQTVTQQFLQTYYGLAEPYRVKIELNFPQAIPDYQDNGPNGSFTIELAPSTLQPHSIHTFLELARTFTKGAFHRFAPHVFQTFMKTDIPHLAFQEYSPDYPHKERTVGYAGRPSGPEWYVSTMDNSQDHGPGTQQKENPHEADSCFGTVIEGYENVVLRMKKIPDPKHQEFIDDENMFVTIRKMSIMVPVKPGSDQYYEWVDPDGGKDFSRMYAAGENGDNHDNSHSEDEDEEDEDEEEEEEDMEEEEEDMGALEEEQEQEEGGDLEADTAGEDEEEEGNLETDTAEEEEEEEEEDLEQEQDAEES